MIDHAMVLAGAFVRQDWAAFMILILGLVWALCQPGLWKKRDR